MRACSVGLLFCLSLAVGCTKPAPQVYQGPRGTPALDRGTVDGPQMVSADKAGLPEDEPVIGVVVGGKARAYTVKALSSIRSHVVNELVDDVPVTVTYCDKADCAKAYTAAHRGERLPLTVGGFMDGAMMLKYEGLMYRQDTGAAEQSGNPPLPFAAMPHERMTWGKWKAKHPETVVFVGLAPLTPQPPS